MKTKMKDVAMGYAIPPVTKVAAMPEWTGETSRIHEESYAKSMGMRGALLGGSQVFAYMSQMLYGFFGDDWLKHGKVSVAFIGGGVIPGDKVTARGVVTRKEPEDSGMRLYLDIWMEHQDGNKVVAGTASCRVS